jgi:hypothetical protein
VVVAMNSGDDMTVLPTLDFFDFATAGTVGFADDILPLFACSTSSRDGGGSVAITTDAVYLGEDDGITRIDAADIRCWSSAEEGRMFALTVESTEAHITHLFAHFRVATVTAMTRIVGPEGVRLRAA